MEETENGGGSDEKQHFPCAGEQPALRQAQRQLLHLKGIRYVQKRPGDALIVTGDADHRGAQDVGDDPKASNGSRLPGRVENTH